MKHTLFVCVLLLSLSLNSYCQVQADPALSAPTFTTLANAPLSATSLPSSGGFKINLPFSNNTAGVALPAGSCKIKMGLGSKLTINTGFDLSTAPYSQYFNWTVALAGGQWEITGDLIADLPGGFSGIAVFELKALIAGNSTVTANFLVTNHNTVVTLSDPDGTNNNGSTPYTITSLISISINQGTSITVCQNASLTLTTTVTAGTAPFTYLWTNGLGTNSSATVPTASIGITTYTVTVNDASSNSANASITVTVTGPNNITASAGANGSISFPGVTAVPCGTGKTYTITPNACYHVQDVLVDGVSQGAITSYTFNNVTAAHTISASFAINTFNITVTPGANGTITPGTGTVNCGSNNTYTITPNACYHIATVTLDGVPQGAVSSVSINNVNANHTISATFAIDTYTITVTPGANGTITPGTGTVNCGSNNTYTITPNTCYHIASVTLDGVPQGAVSSVSINNVNANHTISATFAIDTYTVTVTPGANGTITPGTGTVNCGSNNTYTITPNACYHIVGVVLDGVPQGAVSSVSINNVNANHTITATFAIDSYIIVVSPGANGTITPGSGTVNCGSNNTYTITPNACYHIATVTLDGVPQGAVSSVSINNVNANHTLSATFAIDTYTVTVTPGANGTITPGTGTVNCGSNNTYTITPNACYHIATVTLDGVPQGAVSSVSINNVNANHTITATFAIDTYTVTVTPGANGTITPGTGTVNCGSNNTYTITPNACYHIATVTLDGVPQGAVSSVSVNNVSANHTISATFAIDTYTVTVTPGANGTITPGTGTVNCGSNNTYTITPNACYHIAAVTLDGVPQGAVSSVSINNVNANHTISATFAIDTYTVTVTPGANGTITPGTGTVNCGSNNTYTITPNACYHIATVTLDGVPQGAVSSVSINNVNANHTITATFAIDTYTVTVTPGANGTITPGTGTVNCGSNNTYTITPNACYHIATVTLDGVPQGAVSSVSINNVNANHTITATFAIDTYTITVTPGANGTITPGTGTVNCGSNNTYIITPNACYHIATVTLDGVPQGAVSSVSINNVNANHTISATFAIDTYTITVTPGANGTITPGTGTVNCGSNNTYTITPNACYHIVGVVLDGVPQGAVSSVSVNNVSANHTISATFAIDTYTVTVTPGANGTITPGTGTVNCGSNNTYTITPNACYHIATVTLDGVPQGAVSSVSINNVNANHTLSATFAIDTYTVTVTPGANGTITPGTGTVNCGSNNTYTITPNACYHIATVTLDGVPQGAVSSVSINNVSANHTITATFAIDTYTVTVTPGANGTITPGTGTVNCGSNNTYTITPDACYHIATVTLDGVPQGAVSSVSINNVNANHTISATFAIDTYTVTVTPGANGTITPGSGTVNCGSNNTYSITPDACYHIVDVIVDGIAQGPLTTVNLNNVTANHTITASFAFSTYTITATATANGSISPAGITSLSCGNSQSYTITANAGYHILDVLVDGTPQGALSTYNFSNVQADHTIHAIFALDASYTITATAGANGAVSPAGSTAVSSGNSQLITITANPCYHIADVLVDGISVGAVGVYNFSNVTADHTISATFAIDTYTVTVTPGANGTVTPVTGTVNCGSNNIYTITPNACYHIATVTLDGVAQGAVTSVSINNVNANHTISATFAIDTYTVTVTPGANGTITPGTGTVNCGSNNTYTITPNACYHIAAVTLDGVPQGAVSSVSINNVNANHTITATFAIDTYTVTVTPGANGTITPGTGTVNCGSNNTYTITPNACYHIATVTLDGVPQGAVSSVSINNVNANHTISATFAIDTYTVTVTPGANGTITPGTGTVNCGSNNTYTITPNACYHIATVTLDGVPQGAVSFVSINNVNANHTISATFAIDTYTVTVTPGANGTITPGTGTVNCGSNNTYTITPNACYHIVDVTQDGISQGAVSTFSINNITNNHTIAATFAADIIPVPVVTVTNNCNGTSTLTASNYSGTLLWSDGGTDNPHVVSLAASYTVTQTIGSCTSNASLPVTTAPSTLTAPSITKTQPGCGSPTGTIVVNSPTGAGMTYSINGSDYSNTSGTFSSLNPGSYNVTAKAAGGCISPITVAVIDPQPATANIIVSAIENNSCHDGNAGKITVVGSGATSPYTYTIISGPTINTTGQANGIFTGLAGGNYIIRVNPASGCTGTVPATVTQPAGIYPNISLGADFDNNLFAANGAENNILYNISEVGGNPAVGDTLRIIKVPGYSLLFDINAATYNNGSSTFNLDNHRWKIDNSNPAFVLLILDPDNNNTAGTLNCSELLFITLKIKRNTPNLSTFSLTARLKKADNEQVVNNNLFPIVFTAE